MHDAVKQRSGSNAQSRHRGRWSRCLSELWRRGRQNRPRGVQTPRGRLNNRNGSPRGRRKRRARRPGRARREPRPRTTRGRGAAVDGLRADAAAVPRRARARVGRSKTRAAAKERADLPRSPLVAEVGRGGAAAVRQRRAPPRPCDNGARRRGNGCRGACPSAPRRRRERRRGERRERRPVVGGRERRSTASFRSLSKRDRPGKA